MKIAVFGAGGMLGTEVLDMAEAIGVDHVGFTHQQADITSHQQVEAALLESDAQVAVNCAGVNPQTRHRHAEMARTNAVGPHVLAAECEALAIHLIHVSTDCVFAGPWNSMAGYGRHHVDAPTAPLDLYGRSKLAGEPFGSGVTTIRTSFVGPADGLWAWLVAQDAAGADVQGWANARWSGSTVREVANRLVNLALDPDRPPGVQHLAMPNPWSKDQVLRALKGALGLTLDIEAVSEPRINRALAPSLPPLPDFKLALEMMLNS